MYAKTLLIEFSFPEICFIQSWNTLKAGTLWKSRSIRLTWKVVVLMVLLDPCFVSLRILLKIADYQDNVQSSQELELEPPRFQVLSKNML